MKYISAYNDSLYLVIEPIKTKKLNSERFTRRPVLLARSQTFVLHLILRCVNSSEFSFHETKN